MKRRRARLDGRFFEPEDTSVKTCDHPDCEEKGLYRAPRSRTDLSSYYWFCLDHVREYNASWNYYQGMSMDEVEEDLRHDTTWNRPTWNLGAKDGTTKPRGERPRMRDPFGFFNNEEPVRPGHTRPRPGSPEEQALSLLDIKGPITPEAIKARYKELVKIHHPDANGGDKECEERLKTINQAYRVLMDSLTPNRATEKAS